MIIDIVLRSVSSSGDIALRSYVVQRLSGRERLMCRLAGVSEKRSVLSDVPFVVSTLLVLSGKAKDVVGRRRDYWLDENEKVVVAKMRELGADLGTDYSIEVFFK